MRIGQGPNDRILAIVDVKCTHEVSINLRILPQILRHFSFHHSVVDCGGTASETVSVGIGTGCICPGFHALWICSIAESNCHASRGLYSFCPQSVPVDWGRASVWLSSVRDRSDPIWSWDNCTGYPHFPPRLDKWKSPTRADWLETVTIVGFARFSESGLQTGSNRRGFLWIGWRLWSLE